MLVHRFIIFGFIFVAALTSFNRPILAQKSFLEAMLPGVFGDPLERRAKPEETLQAPFAFDPEREVELGELPQNATPLDRPHRNDLDIADWLGKSVVQSLTNFGQNYSDFEKSIRPFFDANGFGDYQRFLTQTNLNQVLRSGQFQMSAFTKEQPLLLNKVASAGAFRWLFEVPVMVTYLPRGANSYESTDGTSARYMLRLQVRRVADGGGEHGVVIEGWSVTEQ